MDQSCQSLCGERIRFGEEGVGNRQRSRPETVRRKRRRTETTAKTLVTRCPSRWWPRGRSQNLLRRPKPPSPRCIQCRCLSPVCDPSSRMSQLNGRKDKPVKAEMHRIEEAVAALDGFRSSHIPLQKRTHHLNILVVSLEDADVARKKSAPGT